MTIRNCPECGKIFEFVFSSLCPECFERDEADLILIKDYLLGHFGATVADIVQDTGVAAKKVLRLLHDKRLIAVCEKNQIQLLSCERCQKPVLNERFCPECKEFLSARLSRLAKPAGHEDSRKPLKETAGGAGSFTAHFNK
jgi:hypothetical protein